MMTTNDPDALRYTIFDNPDVLKTADVITVFLHLDSTKDRDEETESDLEQLDELLMELAKLGGPYHWRGDSFPQELISDHYFTDYARDVAEDQVSATVDFDDWPFDMINWDDAAELLQDDYTEIEFNGDTYWTTPDGAPMTAAQKYDQEQAERQAGFRS